MQQEIKYAKFLDEQKMVEFLESTGRVRINKNKKTYIKFGKHEVIAVGGTLLEKHKLTERGKSAEHKESNFMCVFNDFQCKLTMAGNGTMNHCRNFLFKRTYAEFLLKQLPDNLKEEYIAAYNAQAKPSHQSDPV